MSSWNTKYVLLQPRYKKGIERKNMKSDFNKSNYLKTNHSGNRLKMNILHAIKSLPDHMCSQPKTVRTVHKLKYRHFWSRLETRIDASVS